MGVVASTALPHGAGVEGERRNFCVVASHRGSHLKLSACPHANTPRHQQLLNDQCVAIPGEKKGKTC